jgi:hypothetical protein
MAGGNAGAAAASVVGIGVASGAALLHDIDFERSAASGARFALGRAEGDGLCLVHSLLQALLYQGLLPWPAAGDNYTRLRDLVTAYTLRMFVMQKGLKGAAEFKKPETFIRMQNAAQQLHASLMNPATTPPPSNADMRLVYNSLTSRPLVSEDGTNLGDDNIAIQDSQRDVRTLLYGAASGNAALGAVLGARAVAEAFDVRIVVLSPDGTGADIDPGTVLPLHEDSPQREGMSCISSQGPEFDFDMCQPPIWPHRDRVLYLKRDVIHGDHGMLHFMPYYDRERAATVTPAAAAALRRRVSPPGQSEAAVPSRYTAEQFMAKAGRWEGDRSFDPNSEYAQMYAPGAQHAPARKKRVAAGAAAAAAAATGAFDSDSSDSDSVFETARRRGKKSSKTGTKKEAWARVETEEQQMQRVLRESMLEADTEEAQIERAIRESMQQRRLHNRGTTHVRRVHVEDYRSSRGARFAQVKRGREPEATPTVVLTPTAATTSTGTTVTRCGRLRTMLGLCPAAAPLSAPRASTSMPRSVRVKARLLIGLAPNKSDLAVCPATEVECEVDLQAVRAWVQADEAKAAAVKTKWTAKQIADDKRDQVRPLRVAAVPLVEWISNNGGGARNNPYADAWIELEAEEDKLPRSVRLCNRKLEMHHLTDRDSAGGRHGATSLGIVRAEPEAAAPRNDVARPPIVAFVLLKAKKPHSKAVYVDVLCSQGGLGRLVLAAVDVWGRQNMCTEVHLRALPYIVPYYQHLGFHFVYDHATIEQSDSKTTVKGGEALEDGVHMVRSIGDAP